MKLFLLRTIYLQNLAVNVCQHPHYTSHLADHCGSYSLYGAPETRYLLQWGAATLAWRHAMAMRHGGSAYDMDAMVS